MPVRRNFVTICCPDAATLQHVLRFDDGVLGRIAGISDTDALERFHSCPDAFHCVVEESDANSAGEGKAVHGFFILLPLTSGCVDRLRARAITSSRQICALDLATSEAPAGLYLSVVCARGRFARVAVIAGCMDAVGTWYRTKGVQVLFVRAATEEGAHMLTRMTNEVFNADRTIHEVNLSAYDAVLRFRRA